MSLDLKYPIVMERVLYCTGQCQRHTAQHSVIYPDTEVNTCKICGHRSTVHYDRAPAVIYTEVDKLELEGLEKDINELAASIANHPFSVNLGKKDRRFLDKLYFQLLAVKRRLIKLKERQD